MSNILIMIPFMTFLKGFAFIVLKAVIGLFLTVLLSFLLSRLSKYHPLKKIIKPIIRLLKSLPITFLVSIIIVYSGYEHAFYLIVYIIIFPIFYDIFYALNGRFTLNNLKITLVQTISSYKKNLYFIFAITILIIFYHLVSLQIQNDMILPKVRSIIEYTRSLKFIALWTNISSTVYKAVSGFLIALIFSLILAIIGQYKTIGEFIKPYISILRSLPTISIILITLIWLGKEKSIYIVLYLVIFPILYEMFYTSLKNMDRNLIEVAKVYRFSWIKKIKYLYFYQVLENFILSLKQTFGLCFKVMVMAEVIGQSKYGIGAQIQNQKVNLETTGVFAWSIILIIMVIIIDTLIDYSKQWVLKWK